MNTKYIIALLCAVIVGFGAYGIYESLKPAPLGGISAPGTSNQSLLGYQTIFNGGATATTTGTSTVWATAFNSDANDRVISDFYYFTSGLETNEQVTLVVATSTQSASTTVNSALFSSILATATASTFYSSSTQASNVPGLAKIWPAGTYLNFIASSTAASATTTTNAVGLVGVKYYKE